MGVTFHKTEIPDVLVVESPIFRDDRGAFTEIHNSAAWAEQGFSEAFRQDNLSVSARGVMRGMHYQIEPHAMGKFVRALHGAIFDVAVDLREGSPCFGAWIARELSAANGLGMWVPAGFAHGFLALEDDTQVLYKCTEVYTPEAERSIVYDDHEIGIEWPFEPTLVADKDRKAPAFKDAEHNFTYDAS